MPTDARILGFSNPWYASGMQAAVLYQLPSEKSIRILDAPHLLATKFCALQDRGEDLRYDADFEDILYILTYRRQLLQEILDSPSKLQQYLSTCCHALLEQPDIQEAIDAAKDYDASTAGIESVMRRIAELLHR